MHDRRREYLYSKLTVSPSLIDIFLYSTSMCRYVVCWLCVFNLFQYVLKNENDIKKKRYLSHPLVDTMVWQCMTIFPIDLQYISTFEYILLQLDLQP